MQSSHTPSETRYAKSGDVHIAYQIVGSGPLDLVVVPGFISHVEWFWEEPTCARLLARLAAFSRLILFDKRGTGLSDRVAQVPTLEQRMDDVRAVLDAAGSERAAIIGVSEGGPMSVLFTATYPERTAALVLYGSFADFSSSVATPQEVERMLQFMDMSWGTGLSLLRFAPSVVDDERFRQWWGRFERLAASPGAAMALIRMNSEIDVRPVLPAVHVPTLILHRRDDANVPVAAGRDMAQRIPGAKYVELAGRDHLPWVGDADAIITETQEFLTGVRHIP
jgi:pimeloyl-ACP methyl ester carboxylesterase